MDDYETVLRGIDLSAVYAHLGGGVVQHEPFTLACYWNAAKRRGTALESLDGTSQADTPKKAARLTIHALTAESQMTYQQHRSRHQHGSGRGPRRDPIAGDISVRIQQILQNEANLTSVVDPLGGAYFIETRTSQVRERAWEFFGQVEERAGSFACQDDGWLHARAPENQAS